MEIGPVIPVFPEDALAGSPPVPGAIPSLEAGLRAMFARQQPQFTDVFQHVVDGLPEQIALLDDEWTILAANPAWTRTAAQYGYDKLKPGMNYFDFCSAMARKGHTPAKLVADGIREMERSGRDTFAFTYHGRDRWEGHAFQIQISRFVVAGRKYATTTRYDITELVHLREMREGFSHSLMEHQAEERRRMAREVHDSTMQLLVAMGLSLGQLKRGRHSKATGDIVEEIEQLLGEAQRELRAISYLAHAPLVAELGLSRALRHLAGGYGRRTGLNIVMHLHEELTLQPAAEVAVYRLVQEALSNVHRHARATDVTVTLQQRRSILHVVVADNGIGMPAKVRRGVGLSSMRSRIEELGGRLMVSKANPGTVLIASVPANAEIRPVGDLAIAVPANGKMAPRA